MVSRGHYNGVVLQPSAAQRLPMRSAKQQAWIDNHAIRPEWWSLARRVVGEVQDGIGVMDALRMHPLADGGYLGKYVLVAAYHEMVRKGELRPDNGLLEKLRMKPMRTLSGVTTVTVLTKPHPCPGRCIFCPTDVRMPKSYLPDEPGAMRGVEHDFEPYAQVRSRLTALENLGHPTDKVELLILGGTWSSYPRDYQERFVRRCFDALNQGSLSGPRKMNSDEHRKPSGDTSAEERECLLQAQVLNENAPHRNVGLVIETRPDEITPDELRWLRHLGVTKVQMGAQSLDDRILAMNQRGHDVDCTRRATALLRAAGFKVVLHWMPNLLGATLDSDHQDFGRLWQGFCPDEIKIYPNQLLANSELYEYWLRGEFHPYTMEQLIDLLADIKPTIPRYCRVNRVIRDIPSTHIVDGNKRTSLRQDVHAELRRRGTRCQCVRCREVRGSEIDSAGLRFNDLAYAADHAEEHFVSFDTPDDCLAGFLRLSLPNVEPPETGIPEIAAAAMIREVHVYGQSLAVGFERAGSAQHVGLGTRLLQQAEHIARHAGFESMAVISAVGTRQYYLDRGFRRGELYLVKCLR
jgi:elongator complex protein 3